MTKTFDDLKWTAKPEWKDGQVHNTLKGDNSANFSGAAYVFVRSGTTWTQQQKLLGHDAGAHDNFAATLARSSAKFPPGASWVRKK